MSNKKQNFKQIWKEELAKAKDFDLSDINDLDWNNMGSWPLIGRSVFLVIIFTLILVLAYVLLINDQRVALAQKTQEEQRLKQEYKAKVLTIANIGLYRKQMVEIQENLHRLLEQLPLAKDIPSLIDDISRSAFEGGLDLKAINPQNNTEKTYYFELPIQIQVSGGYHELATFVSNISALSRIVTLHDFTITSPSDQSKVLNMQVLAKTYQYKEGVK